MSYHSDLYSALSSSIALSDLVGDRIFPDVADASAKAPYIVYSIISTGGETTHDGKRDIEFPSIQITAWATGKSESISIMDAVVSLLDGKTVTGESGLTLMFSNRHGSYDAEERLFGEILELSASSFVN
jgi:hypothetical protein